MALTNRQRVEQALELLKTGLLPYVEREMKSVYGAAKWETQAIAALGDRPLLKGGAWDTTALLQPPRSDRAGFGITGPGRRHREVRALETKRDESDRSYERAKREIDRQKDALLDEISRRMEQQTSEEGLFSIRWQLT